MQFPHKTGTIILRGVCSHGDRWGSGCRPWYKRCLSWLMSSGGQAGRDGGGSQSSPGEHTLATMRPPHGIRLPLLTLLLLRPSSYKRARGRPALPWPLQAHAPPQGAPALAVPPVHLRSLCSTAQENPQPCSALQTLGGKWTRMATSSGQRGVRSPGSSCLQPHLQEAG